MKKILLTAVISAVLFGCTAEEPAAPAAQAPAPAAPAPAPAPEPAAPVADEASYKALHAAAVEALDKAASVGGEWRDSRWKKAKAVKVKVGEETKKLSYLAAAEAYAEMGDFENAIKNAEIAKFQGEKGYEQAMEQKNAGPRH